MNKSYKGFRKPYTIVLSAETDLEITEKIVSGLQNGKLSVSYGHIPGKSEISRAMAIIAILSEDFYQNEKLKQALLNAASLNIEIIPIYTDNSNPPEVLSKILYSVHSLRVERYGDIEELIDRVLSSQALKNPKITANQKKQFRLITIVAVVVAIAIVTFTTAMVVSASTKHKEIMMSYGLSEEDLDSIEYALFAGDTFINVPEGSDIFSVIYDTWDNDNINHFYFAEDGREVPQGSITDISIIKQMHNLKALALVNQPISSLPNLSAFPNLETLVLINCDISDLSFLKDSNIRQLVIRAIPCEDLSPISTLDNLNSLEIMAFAGQSINIENSSMEELSLCNSKRLRDISSLAMCPNIKYIDFNANDNLADISSLSGLTELENVHIGYAQVNDCSALANKPKLKTLSLQDIPFMDTEFLKGLGTDSLEYLHLYSRNETYGVSVDFSGIASLKNIDEFHFSCNGWDYEIIGQYVTGLNIKTFDIGHTRNINFAQLPQGVTTLGLTGYNGSNLSELPEHTWIQHLFIVDSDTIESLDGIEKLSELATIEINECVRLTNYDALYRMPNDFTELRFSRCYTPNLRNINASKTSLVIDIIDPINEFNDVAALAELTDNSGTPITLINSVKLNGVSDIRGLYSLAEKKIKINYLGVDNLLYETAFEYANKLKETTGYECNVEFWKAQNSEWNVNNFKLLSYEEILTLPQVAINAVTDIHIIGNLNPESNYLEWLGNTNDDGTKTFIAVNGPVDMKVIAQLGNLEYMELLNVEIENFEYIQQLQNLRGLRMSQTKAGGLDIVNILAGLEMVDIQDCIDTKKP